MSNVCVCMCMLVVVCRYCIRFVLVSHHVARDIFQILQLLEGFCLQLLSFQSICQNIMKSLLLLPMEKEGANPMKTKVLLENIQFLNDKVFVSDKDLIAHLHSIPGLKGHPLGVVLISPNTSCKLCRSDLIVRSDRPCFLTLYMDDIGTIPSTHYRKYCKNSRRGCSYTQHYGFYTKMVRIPS